MKNNKLPLARQAIVTTYKGPTGTKGSRIYAKCAAGRTSVPYPHEESEGAPAHYIAAKTLADKLGWKGELIPGGLPDGSYVFVFLPEEYSQAVDVVIETRNAMRRGENNGNPHLRKYGRMVDALTDKDDYAPFKARYESREEE